MATMIYIYKIELASETDSSQDKHMLLDDALRRYISSEKGKQHLLEEGINTEELDFAMIDLALAQGEHGKPYFVNKMIDSIHFSISHSGVFWAVAFSNNEIGLDIEDVFSRNRDVERLFSIGKRFFSEEENSYMEDLYDKAKRTKDTNAEIEAVSGFFRIWTRKEAYLKYTGEGISRQLNEFSTLSPINATEKTIIDGDAVIETLIDDDELICSLCRKKEEDGEEIEIIYI